MERAGKSNHQGTTLSKKCSKCLGIPRQTSPRMLMKNLHPLELTMAKMRRLVKPRPKQECGTPSVTSTISDSLVRQVDAMNFCSTYQRDYTTIKNQGEVTLRSHQCSDCDETCDYKLSSSHQDYQHPKVPNCLQSNTTRFGTKYNRTPAILEMVPFAGNIHNDYATTYSSQYTNPKDNGNRQSGESHERH